jgi:hypothetical protein
MSTDLSARAFRVSRIQGIKVLVPADPFADEFMAPLKEGRDILVSTHNPRNPSHHKLLFALLRKVVENSDKWADEKVLLDDLKLATGLFETRTSAITGMPYPVPASIAFSAMSQERFARWFDKALTVLARDVLGVVPQTLRNEVEAMLGERSHGR